MKKLQSYMRKENINCHQLGKKLGCSYSTVYSWIARKTTPGVRMAVKVERVTGGFISVYDW